MRLLLRKILLRLYRPYALWKMSRSNVVNNDGVVVFVPRGVFHPTLFFSTRFLLQTVLQQPLLGKTLLELGCGSGLIALTAARAGALVTATDIAPLALEAIKESAQKNKLPVEIIKSDLFANIPGRKFDIIAVNPPYYQSDVSDMSTAAWFAGNNMEYFHRFFEALPSHIHSQSSVFMVLSEDVNLPLIKSIAAQHQFSLNLKTERLIYLERNLIFCIRHYKAEDSSVRNS